MSLRLRLAGTKRDAVVSALHPAVKYHIRLIAENSIGNSEPSTVLRATTTEEGNISLFSLHTLATRGLEVCMEMGIPIPMGFPWDSHGLGVALGY